MLSDHFQDLQSRSISKICRRLKIICNQSVGTGLWYPRNHQRPDDYDMYYNKNDAVHSIGAAWPLSSAALSSAEKFIICQEIFTLLCRDIFATAFLQFSRVTMGTMGTPPRHRPRTASKFQICVSSIVTWSRKKESSYVHFLDVTTQFKIF